MVRAGHKGGFTVPPGVECVGWNLKSTPLKLDRGVTVLNAEDLVRRHLEILAAKLRGDNAGFLSSAARPPC
jgi:hypothetical protein